MSGEGRTVLMVWRDPAIAHRVIKCIQREFEPRLRAINDSRKERYDVNQGLLYRETTRRIPRPLHDLVEPRVMYDTTSTKMMLTVPVMTDGVTHRGWTLRGWETVQWESVDEQAMGKILPVLMECFAAYDIPEPDSMEAELYFDLNRATQNQVQEDKGQ